MINEDNKTDIIDQYWMGTLDKATRQEVETRMQQDVAFRKEVILQEKIVRTLRNTERSSLKAELSTLFAEENEKEVVMVPTTSHRRWYPVAAAVALLLVAGIFWVANRSATPTYTSYVVVQVPRGGEVPASVLDSIPVRIVRDDATYSFHYQLSDALMLYGPFDLSTLALYYEQQYLLEIDGEFFPLEKAKTVQPLVPE